MKVTASAARRALDEVGVTKPEEGVCSQRVRRKHAAGELAGGV
jgi:hypothetical protein